MKRLLIIAAIIVGAIAIAVGVFAWKMQAMKRALMTYPLTAVDLATVPDGAHQGSFGAFLVAVDVTVTAKDHAITAIDITRQRAGRGYEARETTDRVLKAQSLSVDAVTGATGSSRCILIAIHRGALSAAK